MINNIDHPKDKNYNKNEDKIIETKDNDNDNTDKNEYNDHIQFSNQYISYIKYLSFPKTNRGKTTMFQIQNFQIKTKNVIIIRKKYILTIKRIVCFSKSFYGNI